MFRVNSEVCIGCGMCVKDCFVRDIEPMHTSLFTLNIFKTLLS